MADNRRRPVWLPDSPQAPFPSVELALREPNGLLAVGGDLSPTRLVNAYRNGIFPWFSADQPILWWSPDPRLVFQTAQMRPSRRFRRWLQGCRWTVRADSAFADVILRCATAIRPGQIGTWLTPAMQDAFIELYRLGVGHSIEVYQDQQLVGGLYGLAIGRMFYGESMFSHCSGASKLALLALGGFLRANQMPIIDAQVENPHLMRLGAKPMTRTSFVHELHHLVAQPAIASPWTTDFGHYSAPVLCQPETLWPRKDR